MIIMSSAVRTGRSWVRVLRRTSRLAAVAAWRGAPGGRGGAGPGSGPHAARLMLGAGSLGVALLAADHLYNGLYHHCVKQPYRNSTMLWQYTTSSMRLKHRPRATYECRSASIMVHLLVVEAYLLQRSGIELNLCTVSLVLWLHNQLMQSLPEIGSNCSFNSIQYFVWWLHWVSDDSVNNKKQLSVCSVR